MTSAINHMFSAKTLERATEAALRKWYPDYLIRFEQQEGLTEKLKIPTNYRTRNSLEGSSGEDLPALYIISPGIIGTPRKKGGGKYSASWRLGIGIGMAAETEGEADLLVKAYCAVAREIILENSGFGALGATNIEWTDETYVDPPVPNAIRQYKAGTLFFTVDVDNVATNKPGPTTPNQPNYDYGQVEKVFVDVVKVPVTKEVDGG